MDRKIAENLMMSDSELGRDYRDLILNNQSINQMAERDGIDILSIDVDDEDEDEQMTTLEEINNGYALCVGMLATEVSEYKELDLNTVLSCYLKTPEDYLDALYHWGTLPTEEATKDFLDQFYSSEKAEEIFNTYKWDI